MIQLGELLISKTVKYLFIETIVDINELIEFGLVVGTTLVSVTWFLRNQIHDLHQSVDKIGDGLREYIIANDNKVERERDRITALNYNLGEKICVLHERLSNIEEYLQKDGYVVRKSSLVSMRRGKETQGEFIERNPSELQE
jgi:hypothetical protein